MKKITLVCMKKNNSPIDKLAVFFQGWLMEHVNETYAEQLHLPGPKPYTVQVKKEGKHVCFIVNLLTDHANTIIGELLLQPGLKEICLASSQQKTFNIVEKKMSEQTQADLTALFYQEEVANTFTLHFDTPTSFKSHGEYVFFPDLSLILQSLIKKYNFVFEGNEKVEIDLLEQLCKTTKIVSYRISSSYYPIHHTFIPGFRGEIRIRSKGNQTLKNYLHMLLVFSAYSGVGIKTSMGMGAMSVRQEKKGEKKWMKH